MSYAVAGSDLIDVFAGGHLPQNVVNTLSQMNHQVLNNVSGYAREFINTAANLYQMVSTNDAMIMMRNMTAKSEDIWVNDIGYLPTIEKLQTAGTVMQRWIMAEPTTRGLYLNQEIEGYEGSYINIHGDAIGARHHDYRQVMDGVVELKENDSSFTNYYEYIPDHIDNLTFFNKVDILRTWAIAKQAAEDADEDHTSVVGNKR